MRHGQIASKFHRREGRRQVPVIPRQISRIISGVVRLPYLAVAAVILVFFIAVSLILVSPVNAQRAAGSGTDSALRKLTYDVVSIRPSNLEGMSINSSGDRFVARGTTLWGILFNAYKLRPHDEVPGLPGWAKSERFDVEAGMDADTYAELQRMPVQEQSEEREMMLQALLADRFQLKGRYESRERPIYALVIAKSGSRLKESPSDKIPGGISWGGGQIEVHGAPMERFAFCLSDTLDRAVVDKTGLTGRYDISLKWTPEELQGTSNADPSIFTAIQEQLGLKLESTRGTVQTFVVDHVERPSEN
jgi:uncharacterized protein (TIGR03435 family)